MSSTIEDFQRNGLWVRTMTTGGVQRMTVSCVKWYNMMARCKAGGAMQKLHPTYVGCYVSEEFKDFQTFTNWHTQQIGYGLGYELDKDILIENNKLYSQETCVLVPRSLNAFLCSAGTIRGKFPQGVCWNKRASKFEVSLRVSGIKKSIGRYSDLESAKLAYKEAKEDEALRWYDRLKNGEFVVDERVIDRMRVWRFND